MKNIKNSNYRNYLVKLSLSFVILIIIFWPFVIVNAGERGVMMQFGEVQETILGEGLHIIIPIVNTVKKLSVQVQKQDITTEALSKDF